MNRSSLPSEFNPLQTEKQVPLLQKQRELMALWQWCAEYDVQIWAYCLMPNHVHLIAVPSKKDMLHLAIGEVDRRYAH